MTNTTITNQLKMYTYHREIDVTRIKFQIYLPVDAGFAFFVKILPNLSHFDSKGVKASVLQKQTSVHSQRLRSGRRIELSPLCTLACTAHAA